MKDLTEFGERLVMLQGEHEGLREQLKCEVKAAGDHELNFIATDESVDRYREVIRLDGWELKNYRANPVVLDSHNYWSIASILGRSTEVTIEKGRMTNRVKFAVENPLGNLAFKLAKSGFIQSESVGFIPLDWENMPGAKDGEPNRIFTKQELLEISLVSVPANPGATIGAALKSGALEKGDVTEVYQLLKQFCTDKAEGSLDSRARGEPLDGALVQLARCVDWKDLTRKL
jgi:HK97 family phage prohead protease